MKILQLEWKINFNIGGFNEKKISVIAILIVAGGKGVTKIPVVLGIIEEE